MITARFKSIRRWQNLIGLIAVSVVITPCLSYGAVLRFGTPATAVTAAYPFARDEGGAMRYAIYDALTWHDPSGQLTPRLALSWENVSPLKWVFQLRQGVIFSNGESFDANSAVATLTALYDPNDRHPRINDMGSIKSFRALNPYELEITTSEPDPLLPKRLTLLPMIAPKAWADMGKDIYSRAPIGTGPYSVESWGSNNTRPVLVNVPTSWRPIHNVTRVEMTVIREPATRIAGLLSGRLDIASGFSSDDIPMLRAAGFDVRILFNPNILSIAFRTVRDDPSPLLDTRVRLALNYAVDKRSIVQHIRGGTARAAHQPAMPGLVGYNDNAETFAYDPVKARALLAEAGYEDGFSLKFLVYGGLLPGDTLIFQKVAQDLRNVGVAVELRQISFPDYVRRIFNGNWEDADGFSIGWMNNLLWDPQRAIRQFSCAYSAPFYCDQDLMPLIDAARVEMDPSNREALLENIIGALNERGAALWLIDFSGSVALHPDINIGEFKFTDGTMFEAITLRRDDE